MRALIFQHIGCEGPGLLGDVLRARGFALHTSRLDRGEPVADPLDFDLLAVLGGPMSVRDELTHPFLAAEREALRRAVAAGVPCLGICLGGQLLAAALGARVRPNPVKEIGFSEVALTPAGRQDPLLGGAGAADTLPVFQWHGETFDIPEGAVHLASAPACAHQAFRYGRAAWGLQFHLEVTRAMVEDWLEAYADEVAATPDVDPGRVLADADARLPLVGIAGRRVFARFVEMVVSGALR